MALTDKPSGLADKKNPPYLQKVTRAFKETGKRLGSILGRASNPDLMKKIPKQLVVSSTPYEVRVALLEHNVPVEYLQEWKQEQGCVGNIYRGKVTKVLPGMQAAFVDIGHEKAGFLHNSKISEAMLEEYDSWREATTRRSGKRGQKIQDLVRQDQELLIQIAKDAIGTKGARLTTHISRPGRYLVLMPTETHVGISRRIANEQERQRLRELIHRLKPSQTGCIVRTEAEGCSEEELRADLEYLTRLWGKIQKTSETAIAPQLIHTELDPVLRAVRDLFSSDTDRLLIDNKEDYRRVADFIRTFQPHFRQRVSHYSGKGLLFDLLEIEPDIQQILQRKIWLKSGGHLTFDQTEALVSIDVNTGRFVGRGNLEETVFKTNLEAVREIARQIRLRNLGGIIILDLIDMATEKNRRQVYRTLEDALKPDRANTKILKISEFGLVEMTRKRTRESILQLQTRHCPYCEGQGYIKDNVAICHEIFRAAQRLASKTRDRKIEVRAHPEIVTLLLDEKRHVLHEVEKITRKKLVTKIDTTFHHEKFEVKSIR